jgi:hypothetical protein
MKPGSLSESGRSCCSQTPSQLALATRWLQGLALLLTLLCSPGAWSQNSTEAWLDVSIGIFTEAEPADLPSSTTTSGAAAPTSQPASPASETSPEVRLAERRYLPMYLRYRLEASERFGAVRVLPEPDNGAQLLIEGRILQSDGASLELELRARDSTGRVWLDRRYSGTAISSVSINEDPLAQDDFAYLFTEILRDLLAVLDTLSPQQREEITTVSLLRYGLGLVPQHFDGYLQERADGTVGILRLPAANDPMLARIATIREREYLFIDVVDQEYQRFFGEVKPVYDMWRQAQREQASTSSNFESRQAGSTSQFSRGSYYALQESYNNYRWAKVQELYRDELREGFANEVEPTELELEDSLYKLTGTMDQQYREWRSILAELFELEMGR